MPKDKPIVLVGSVESKECNNCHEIKPLSKFHKRSNSSKSRGICKDCLRPKCKTRRLKSGKIKHIQKTKRIENYIDLSRIEIFHKSYDIVGDHWIWNRQTKCGVPVISLLAGELGPTSKRGEMSARKYIRFVMYGELNTKIWTSCGYGLCVNPEHLILHKPGKRW